MLKIFLISVVIAFVSTGCTKKRGHNARVARGGQQQPAQTPQSATDNLDPSSASAQNDASAEDSGVPHNNNSETSDDSGQEGVGPAPTPALSESTGNSSNSTDADNSQSAGAVPTVPPVSDSVTSSEITGGSSSGSATLEAPSPVKSQALSSGVGGASTGSNQSQEDGQGAKSASSASTEPQDDGLIKLTFDQSFNFAARMQQNFSPDTLKNLLKVRLPQGMDGEALDIKLEGDHKKATYLVTHKSDVVVEFKDIEFSVANQTNLEAGDYKLVALCIDAKCSILFLNVYKIENERWTVNIPVIMAWVDGRYQAARPLTQEEQVQYMKDNNIDPAEYIKTKEKELKEGKSSAPPQLRVKYQLQENIKKTLPSLINSLGNRMKKDNSIYSARLFTNVKSGSLDWKFRATPQGLEVDVKIEFVDSEKRKRQEYYSVVPDRGVRIQDKNSRDTLDVYPILQSQFFLMVFENANFASELPNSKKAIQAVVCQVLVEDEQTYSECEFLPSTYVLGIEAQEGRIGGPVLINRGDIKNQYTPVDPQEFIKQLSDAGA